jgi:peptide chain release factor 3
MFVQPHVGLQDPILGVVGSLQFDVLMFRLKDEYGVDAVLDRLPFTLARWLKSSDPDLKVENLDMRVPLVKDSQGHWVVLCSSEWEFQYLQKNSPPSIEWLHASPQS